MECQLYKLYTIHNFRIDEMSGMYTLFIAVIVIRKFCIVVPIPVGVFDLYT